MACEDVDNRELKKTAWHLGVEFDGLRVVQQRLVISTQTIPPAEPDGWRDKEKF